MIDRRGFHLHCRKDAVNWLVGWIVDMVLGGSVVGGKFLFVCFEVLVQNKWKETEKKTFICFGHYALDE